MRLLGCFYLLILMTCAGALRGSGLDGGIQNGQGPLTETIEFRVDEGEDLDKAFTNAVGSIYFGEIKFNLTIDKYYGTASEIKEKVAKGLLPSHVTIHMRTLQLDSGRGDHYSVSLNGKRIGKLSSGKYRWRISKFENVPIESLNFPTSEGGEGVNAFYLRCNMFDTGLVANIDWVSVSITEGQLYEFAAPQNLEATTETNGIRLTWDAVDGAEMYGIYWSDNRNQTFERLAVLRDVSYLHQPKKGVAELSGIYKVCVISNDKQVSQYSNEVVGRWLEMGDVPRVIGFEFDSASLSKVLTTDCDNNLKAHVKFNDYDKTKYKVTQIAFVARGKGRVYGKERWAFCDVDGDKEEAVSISFDNTGKVDFPAGDHGAYSLGCYVKYDEYQDGKSISKLDKTETVIYDDMYVYFDRDGNDGNDKEHPTNWSRYWRPSADNVIPNFSENVHVNPNTSFTDAGLYTEGKSYVEVTGWQADKLISRGKEIRPFEYHRYNPSTSDATNMPMIVATVIEHEMRHKYHYDFHRKMTVNDSRCKGFTRHKVKRDLLGLGNVIYDSITGDPILEKSYCSLDSDGDGLLDGYEMNSMSYAHLNKVLSKDNYNSCQLTPSLSSDFYETYVKKVEKGEKYDRGQYADQDYDVRAYSIYKRDVEQDIMPNLQNDWSNAGFNFYKNNQSSFGENLLLKTNETKSRISSMRSLASSQRILQSATVSTSPVDAKSTLNCELITEFPELENHDLENDLQRVRCLSLTPMSTWEDGEINILRATLSIESQGEGDIRLCASLADSGNKPVVLSTVYTNLLEGTNTIIVDFDGRLLYECGGSGYSIKTLEIYSLDSAISQIIYAAKDVGVTSEPYNSTMFKAASVIIRDNYSSALQAKKTVDVSFDLEVNEAGNYGIAASLYRTNSYNFVASAGITNQYYSVGTHRVTLPFPVEELYASRIAPPYSLSILNVSKNGEVLARAGGEYVVDNIALEDIRPENAVFSYDDDSISLAEMKYGEGGRYEGLSFNLTIGNSHTSPIDCFVSAILVGTNDAYVATTSFRQSFVKGDNAVMLSFKGEDIYNREVDGPYGIQSLTITPSDSACLSERYSSSFRTDAYLHGNFEPSEVRLVGAPTALEPEAGKLGLSIPIEVFETRHVGARAILEDANGKLVMVGRGALETSGFETNSIVISFSLEDVAAANPVFPLYVKQIVLEPSAEGTEEILVTEVDVTYTDLYDAESLTWNYSKNSDGASITITGVEPSTVCGFISIPSEIDGYAVTAIGEEAFMESEGVVFFKIPDGVTSIEAGAFLGCTSLKNVILPKSLTSIAASAFESCCGLTSVVMPESVERIGDSAFDGCSGLMRLEIPEEVNSVGDLAFASCFNLQKISASSGLQKTLEKMKDDGQITARIVYVDVQTDNGVLFDWINNYYPNSGSDNDRSEANRAKFEAKVLETAANGINTIEECFIAGLVPTNREDKFTTEIVMENGQPTLRWSPDLNDGDAKADRLYTIVRLEWDPERGEMVEVEESSGVSGTPLVPTTRSDYNGPWLYRVKVAMPK